MNILENGKVWKLGHNIDTDVITPGKYMSLTLEEMKMHVLEPIKPDFAINVKTGDLIVAGRNFGCGSSREHAVTALKALGLGGVVADSFARIFFRNAIAHGFPILILPGALDFFNEGDEAELDIEKATVKNYTSGEQLTGTPLSHEMLDMIREGGIIALLKKQLIVRRG